MNALDRYAGTVYCIMRIVVGLLFACHGAQKLFGWFGGKGGAQGMMLLGGIIEVAGLLIAVGLFTRPLAFLASGMMAWAYFTVHAAGKTIKHPPPITPAEHFFPILNGGESAVIYCFLFLFIFFYGAGWLSLDAMIWRKTAVTDARA